jgi:transcriptional regulator with XRE-family HTH domain
VSFGRSAFKPYRPRWPVVISNRKDQTVGDRIAIARGFYRMSQADLAKRLSLTRAAVSQYEADQILPRRRVIERLTEIFGSSSGWFELGVGLPPRPPERTVPIVEIESHLVTNRVSDLRDLRGQREWGVPSSVLDRHDVGDEAIIIYAPDDVAPEIQRGDHVLVDLARTEIKREAIYFVIDDDRPQLLRLKPGRRKTGLMVRGQVVGYFRIVVSGE